MLQFHHEIPRDVQLVPNRKTYVAEYCRGKKVLHIGCVDAGLTKERINRQEHLHMMLLETAQRVWGIDIDVEGLETLRSLGVSDLFFADTEDLSQLVLDDEPDVVVASEVMEHLPNPGRFLEALKRFNCEILISVPNAYSYRQFQAMLQGEEFVHEDHNYYFSYATLNALFRKHGYDVKKRTVYYWASANGEIEKMLAKNPFFGDGLIYTVQKSGLSTPSETPKVAFFAGDGGHFHFCQDIIAHFRLLGCEIRMVEGVPTEAQIAEHMRWSDLSWFEWGNGPIIPASKMPKTCEVVLRIHRYEVYTDAPRHINWENIDHLFFVSPFVLETFKQLQVPDIEQRTQVTVLPNAVDFEKFSLSDKPRGFNIAYVNRVHGDKNPAMLLQIMERLVRMEPRFRCFIAGRVQDLAAYNYLQKMIRQLGLEAHVSFDGVIEDMDAWLSDKHYVLSTSLVEGHPVSIIEGMAKGLKPVIHNYYGDPVADFGESYVFNTIDEAVSILLEDSYTPSDYRDFAQARYSLSEQFATLERLLFEGIEAPTEPTPEPPSLADPAIECFKEDLALQEPYQMPDQRDYAILLSDTDDNRLMRAVEGYLKAFTDEDVSLHVFAGDRLEEIQNRILALIEELGLDPERIPDLSITDEAQMPKRLHASIRAVQLVLGDPQTVALARRFGVPALVEVTSESLRDLYRLRPDISEPASLDVKAPERILVADWRKALPTFLAHPSQATLVVSVPNGQADSTQAAIAEWLESQGHDPEQVPDIAIVETWHPQDAGMFRAATAWFEDGCGESRLVAEVYGIPVLDAASLAATLERPLISILIPTYNRARFLHEALDSVMEQSLEGCEILVVDDGSTDNTEEVVARYPVRFIKKPHSGAPETRNMALAEAKGRYLLWLDSDDAMLPGLLADYRRLIWEFPQVDVFYGNVMITDDKLNETSSFDALDLYGQEYVIPQVHLEANPIPNTCVLVRKSVYEAVGGYSLDFPRAHDYEFWTRAGLVIRVKHAGRTVAKWRWHNSNMSTGTVKVDLSYEIKAMFAQLRRFQYQDLFRDLDWKNPSSSLPRALERLAAQFEKLGHLELATSFRAKANALRVHA